MLVVREMILGLVFSKDRAMQLDGTLTSFYRQAVDGDSAQMVILFRASSDQHAVQYAELEREYRGRVQFVPETQFRRQLLLLLDGASPAGPFLTGILARLARPNFGGPSTADNHVLFLVDDALFVRSFRLDAAAQAMNANADVLGFSLRLGRNTQNCYVLGRTQVFPAFEPLANRVLKFAWPEADGDFAYPLELSSSLYRASDLANLVRRLRFGDPNTLESQMSLQARRFSRRRPCLLCWDQSVAFSAPLNRVQQVFENRRAGREALSTESLSDLFQRGQRIDVGALDGFVPSGCHQEVQLQFEERNPKHV